MQKIKYIEGDLFALVKTDKDPGPTIIAHCCNDKGAFGAGFVVPLAKNFPSSKDKYLQWHTEPGLIGGPQMNCTGEFGLGETQFVNIDDKIFVANMVAQTLGGVRPLFYNHLSRCLDAVAKFEKFLTDSRLYPAKIIAPAFGSGLAGGDWEIVEQLIYDSWIRRDIPVTICYLPGTLPAIENRNHRESDAKTKEANSN